MIQSLQISDKYSYLNKNSCITSFGKNSKNNENVCSKSLNDTYNIKYPTKQALLLTLGLLAAQNVCLINTVSQSTPFIIENSVEASSGIDDSTLNTYDISFSSPKIVFDKKEFNVIAHRGYTATAPENTIPAFIEAAKKGYDKVECDIAWTKDSVPVLLHDDTINRTARYSNGWKPFFPKKSSDLTYEQLQKYDFGIWKGEEYEGTKIPTLLSFLECCKEYNLQPYIEIKQTSEFDAQKAKILADTVKQAGMEDSVTWISFNSDYLKLIGEEAQNCRLGFLTKGFSPIETIQTLQNLKTGSNDVFLDIKARAVNEGMKDVLSEAGFNFEAWTVDSPEELVNLITTNCSGVTTDFLTNTHIEEIFLGLDGD